MREYCVVCDSPFFKLEDLYELEMGCASPARVSILLADTPYYTPSARGTNRSAHDVLSKNYIEDALSFTRSLTARAAQDHIFCSAIKLSF